MLPEIAFSCETSIAWSSAWFNLTVVRAVVRYKHECQELLHAGPRVVEPYEFHAQRWRLSSKLCRALCSDSYLDIIPIVYGNGGSYPCPSAFHLRSVVEHG
jgi:hypothetical protein